MVKTPFVWFCIWPDCSAERQGVGEYTFLFGIWWVRHFAKRHFRGEITPCFWPENKGKTARDLCRKWACQGRFDAAKMLCDTAKNGPESAVEMLKIYERIRAENCEKIGEKPLNFMKSSENYVQIAQKTM